MYTFTEDNTAVGEDLICNTPHILGFTYGELCSVADIHRNNFGALLIMIKSRNGGAQYTRVDYMNVQPQEFLPLKIFPPKAQMVANLTGVMPRDCLES